MDPSALSKEGGEIGNYRRASTYFVLGRIRGQYQYVLSLVIDAKLVTFHHSFHPMSFPFLHVRVGDSELTRDGPIECHPDLTIVQVSAESNTSRWPR
ncbi:hypothetical protein AFLA_008299 [Aspergillus flavus NRRL3357]|nr:hypothetical protein AFLA_008299 [Aspergillus flavus NRRL3357]